jgi:hypothetical protein
VNRPLTVFFWQEGMFLLWMAGGGDEEEEEGVYSDTRHLVRVEVQQIYCGWKL